MTDLLLSLSEADFARLVNAALKNYGSLLELSRSPLAAPELIGPALVLDEVNPTADDRGRALRCVDIIVRGCFPIHWHLLLEIGS